jgi:hypothetical protein
MLSITLSTLSLSVLLLIVYADAEHVDYVPFLGRHSALKSQLHATQFEESIRQSQFENIAHLMKKNVLFQANPNLIESGG